MRKLTSKMRSTKIKQEDIVKQLSCKSKCLEKIIRMPDDKIAQAADCCSSLRHRASMARCGDDSYFIERGRCNHKESMG